MKKISKKNKAAFMLLLICNLVVAVLAFTYYQTFDLLLLHSIKGMRLGFRKLPAYHFILQNNRFALFVFPLIALIQYPILAYVLYKIGGTDNFERLMLRTFWFYLGFL
jgi:hypothetical protein